MKVSFYANLYPPIIGSCGHVYETRELADQMAGRDRVACIEFTAELSDEGEGHVNDNEPRQQA